MKRHTLVRVDLPSQRLLDAVFKALEPETRVPPTQRSRAYLEKKDTCLVLEIHAEDTVALRATANAYLRWMNSLTSVLALLDE